MVKNPLFGYSWARVLKNYCNISNPHRQIYQTRKFHEKNKKCQNLGRKMSYLGAFGLDL